MPGRMAELKRRPWLWGLLTTALLLAAVSCRNAGTQPGEIRPIPDGPFSSRLREEERLIRGRLTGPAEPIAHVPVPQHPFMAPGAGNNMHNDAYMSDTYEAAGPVGLNPRVFSRTQGFGGYGTISYDRAERLVAVQSNGRSFQLELMDPYTLEELASFDLPARPRTWLLQGVLPWEYLGAGTYFYLDNEYRAVVPTTQNTLQVIQVPEPGTAGVFSLVRAYDLSDHVVAMRWPKEDSVAWVLPEWSGEYYWYATTRGMVGTVNVESGRIHSLQLEEEVVENSFAVGEDGVFIISDRAMYRFSRGADSSVVVDWRTEYDRGPGQKPGHITRGSGTSVTLTGGRDGLVIIADNAEPQIHVEFLRRLDGSVVCSIPVFEPGRSGTDVTTAGLEQADAQGRGTGVYSALIENNWGHHTFPRSRPEPGLTRIDATRLETGTYRCEQVWASAERGIGVFKLSLGSGLAYMYWRGGDGLLSKWYLTGVDFRTGETAFKALAGTGLGYNNWAGALFLHPDGGLAYSTTLFGLVAVQDSGEAGE